MLALFLVYQMVMIPAQNIVALVNEGFRSECYVNILALMCVSSPFLYDVSVITLDFPSIIYIGITMYAIQALLDDGAYSSHKCIFYYVLAQHCSIANRFCL